MKNLFRFAMAVAVLFTASCAKEDISSSIGGGEVEVTFTANLADMGTRAYGDGTSANVVFVGVYEAGSKTPLELVNYTEGYPVVGKQATITLVLLKDKKYDLVFWAQNNAQTCYGRNWEDRSITVNYKGAKAQDETRDAFFLVKNNWQAGKDETTFELRRPFAQLRAGISQADFDYVKANGSAGIATSAAVVEGVANVLNLNNEAAEVYGDVTATFDVADVAAGDDEKFAVNGVDYYQLSMNYLLVREKTLVDVTYTFADDDTQYTRPYYNVPVQRNYRTNIIGQLISSPMDFTVVIKPEFDGEYNDVWDGQTVAVPAYDDATKTYTIVKPSELAWLASAVNGTLETRAVAADSFKGKTFVLANDIELGYKEWTPIGNASNNFQGTFDGNGKTISSLYINTPSESNVGLFGMTTDGEIKNLTIQNAKVSGRLNVAVVAGTPYTSKYTNITVKGHVEVNGMAYVGAVGGKNAYANWEDITVEADKTSYVKANSVEDGKAYRTYVGGVCGFNGEGGHSFKNITSNIDVEGSTCDVGGLFGIAHYGNKFENCVCTGNVTIAEANEEIGGIAGVWNNGGADVVMTNCSFTGNLIATTGELTVWYGGLVGKPYSASGTGKLIIDDIVMTGNGVGEKEDEANVYYISSAEGLKWVEAQEDKFFAGKTIKLANDIDMTGVTIEKPIHFWNGRTTFDGQNYTISNLTMSTTSTEKKPFGLFGGTADIKNVKFDNANISGYSYVAVVAGNLYGNIDNCHVANSTVTCTYWMAGAMSGQYNAGNVTNCSVKNTTVTGPAAVAALIGNINETAGERKVENCVVEDCTIAQNSSFGGDYDKMFATAVGLINIENSKVYFNTVTVADTTVKGVESTLLFGSKDDTTTVYVDGSELISDGLLQNNNTYIVLNGAGFKTVATTILADASKNVTIELANDIDLAGIEWPAVKTAAAFVLDGKGKSIKNLTTSAVEDHGFYSTAMFTSTRKATTIKNLVVENATVTGNGRDNSHGAVLVACNYASLNFEGVTVKNSTVSNCDRSSVITTYLYFTTATVKNCVVEGCTVNSIGTAGALLGMNNGHNFEATGNTVKNTTISSSEGSNKAGILIGTWQDAGTLTESNNVVENSKAINAGTETNNNIGRHA